MRGISVSIITFVIVFCAKPERSCDGFVEPNDIRIPVGFEILGMRTGITQAEFDGVLDKIYGVYNQDFKDRGATFTIKRSWTDTTVNAFAVQSGKDWQIHMYGGLARYPGMSVDGFMAVACHEVGHHLGGTPKYGGHGWASIEGQADYFAMLKCMRRMFERDDNEKVISGMKLDPLAVKGCEDQFKGRPDQTICIRSAQAGIVLGQFLANLSSAKPVSLATPDALIVDKNVEGHPKAQCRLDTYFGGAICPVAYHEPMSDSDVKLGTCHDGNLTPRGLRPRCWYKP